MVGLLDIAPATETVAVRGQKLPVYGVSAKGVAYLLSRFPELREMMTGHAVEASRLLEIGGDAVQAIIASGLGFPGDAAQEDAAGRLGLDEQAEILSAVLRLTLPNGIAPFAERLTALGAIVSGEGLPKLAPKSRKR